MEQNSTHSELKKFYYKVTHNSTLSSFSTGPTFDIETEFTFAFLKNKLQALEINILNDDIKESALIPPQQDKPTYLQISSRIMNEMSNLILD